MGPMRFLTQLVSTMAAVAVAAWLFDGIRFDGVSEPFTEQVADKILPLTLVSLILWAVQLVVRPIVNLLSLPLIVLTLGLFLFVVNALMLMLVAWIADALGLGFHVDGFWTALGGALVITIVGTLVNLVVKD